MAQAEQSQLSFEEDFDPNDGEEEEEEVDLEESQALMEANEGLELEADEGLQEQPFEDEGLEEHSSEPQVGQLVEQRESTENAGDQQPESREMAATQPPKSTEKAVAQQPESTDMAVQLESTNREVAQQRGSIEMAATQQPPKSTEEAVAQQPGSTEMAATQQPQKSTEKAVAQQPGSTEMAATKQPRKSTEKAVAQQPGSTEMAATPQLQSTAASQSKGTGQIVGNGAPSVEGMLVEESPKAPRIEAAKQTSKPKGFTPQSPTRLRRLQAMLTQLKTLKILSCILGVCPCMHWFIYTQLAKLEMMRFRHPLCKEAQGSEGYRHPDEV